MLLPYGFHIGSWRILAVPIALLLLQWTAHSGSTVTAAVSPQAPGDIMPKKIEMPIGADANITCHIFRGGNSSTLWFSEENSNTRFVQPSDKIVVLNARTAVLMIRNATEHMGRYQCMSGEEAIGITYVYVGTPPTNVSDFSCRGYDYEYMTCNFTRPNNMIYTTYELNYATDSDNQNYSYACGLQATDKYTYCNLTSRATQVYLPSREIYYFNLTASNALGTSSQIFSINNNRIVVPAKLNIVLRHITTDSITLSWRVLKISYYKEQGLEYEIQLRPKGLDWYYATDYEHCNNATCSITIRNLKYPYHEYMVRVRVKVRTAKDDESMWSEPYAAQFRTLPRRPDFPPQTAVGGFYIDPTETQVRLYWQQLSEYEQNGLDFRYVINETDVRGNVINSTQTNETSIIFNWQRSDVSNYYVKAANALGDSLTSNQIQVSPTTIYRFQYSPHTIATVYHNRTYTLSWKPPPNKIELSNYTVFWCLSKMESPNQCKGTIQFKYLTKEQTNFTTDPQDHTLNLAVSANYPNYNSGMHWARCSADVSSDLMKLEPDINALSATSMQVQWSSERVCTSILKGYNLTYCRVTNDDKDCNSDCLSNPETVMLLIRQEEYKNYTIQNLKPYSNYRVQIFMYSQTKVGPISDAICKQTKEAAPSAPTNLQVNLTSVTSNSAEISWIPPTEMNGKLQYYTIWKIKNQTKDHSDHQIIHVNDTNISSTEPITFKVESLNSFSHYEVYVTAHTIEDSLPSETINFSTLIGRPSNPRQVSIEEAGDYGMLQWHSPEMPSGRVEFYAVSMVTKHKNKVTNEDDVQEVYSLVKGNSCRFRFPECIDSSYSYFLKVRAINVAAKHEIDHSTFPNAKTAKRRRHTNPEINATYGNGLHLYNSPVITAATERPYRNEPREMEETSTYATTISPTSFRFTTSASGTNIPHDFANVVGKYFACMESDDINESYKIYSKHLNDDIGIEGDINFFASPWENSPNIYKCSDFPLDNIVIIAVMVILLAAILGLMSFWVRKKYNKMKNIEAVLPEGLVEQLPNYKNPGANRLDYDSSGEKEQSDISRSNDCLVYQHKEDHCLLEAKCNESTHGLSSLIFNNDMSNDNKHAVDELHSLEESNEERSSHSTDTVELSDVGTSPDYTISSANIETRSGSPNDYQIAQSAAAAGGGGYVTPAMILATSHAGNVVNNTPSNLPAPPSGYIQPHSFAMLAPQTNTNGYITLDSISKGPTTPQNEMTDSEAPMPVDSKLRDMENTYVDIAALNNGNANNNTSINGYVTHRQLAEYGIELVK